jgi:solute carrier family 13 (sodium-dependent dicarboxylate transporter), member 2/3/5
VIPAAIAVGINPAAAAFASTAAAGLCQTLPSSAKPVAIFAGVDGVPTYGRRDLLRLAAVLGPLLVALVGLFAVVVWPLLGMPLLMEAP